MNSHTPNNTPPAFVLTRSDIEKRFTPLFGLLSETIRTARDQTTLERFRRLHPEIEREAGLKRLAGQERWLLIADGLVRGIETVDGFWIHSTESQHNSGRYLFRFDGGLLTVRKEPHDEADPDDGRYVQEAMGDIKRQAPLAPGVDPDEPIVVYLSVTATSSLLKVRHPSLDHVLKIKISDLAPVIETLANSDETPRKRTRARSARQTRAAHDGRSDVSAESRP